MNGGVLLLATHYWEGTIALKSDLILLNPPSFILDFPSATSLQNSFHVVNTVVTRIYLFPYEQPSTIASIIDSTIPPRSTPSEGKLVHHEVHG